MKPWYKQKTFWAGLSIIIATIGKIVTGEGSIFALGPDLFQNLIQLAAGAGLITLRSAVNK